MFDFDGFAACVVLVSVVGFVCLFRLLDVVMVLVGSMLCELFGFALRVCSAFVLISCIAGCVMFGACW